MMRGELVREARNLEDSEAMVGARECLCHLQVFLIMELLTGGELFDAVIRRGSYTEMEARTCFKQLLSGIEHMHSRCETGAGLS